MLRTGDVVNGTYLIDQEIGSGALGVIYRAYHIRLQKYVVLKKIKLDRVSYDKFRIEVDTLKSIRNSYLPGVYDYLECNDGIYTVMDYIEGCDLKQMVSQGRRFSEDELVKWLRQMCSVLDCLHRNNPPVIHSDIKPDNIMIDNNENVCLIDFNIAGGQGMTREYASPEQYQLYVMRSNRAPNAELYAIDGRSDLYSLGATFYFLMTGVVPDVQWINVPKLSSYSNLMYSEALAEIVDKLMERDLSKRFQSGAEVLQALDNIKKSDSRYKRYILMQLTGAIVFILLLVVGVRMILVGLNMQLSNEYLTSYSELFQLYKYGNYENVVKSGYDFLNSTKYSTIKTDKEIAQVYYIMGNSAYKYEDYGSAVQYFEEAYRLMSFIENKSDLYIDYAVSLARNDRVEEAQRVLDEAKVNDIGGAALNLANAEISFIRGDFALSLGQASECLKITVDDNKLERCYVLIARIYDKFNDYEKSIKYFKEALTVNEAPDTLRRLAGEYVKLSTKYPEQDAQKMECIRNAEDALHRLYNGYKLELNDYINLGAFNRTIEDYDFSIRVLNEGITEYSDNCRLYLNLALTYAKMGQHATAADAAAKAMQYYDSGMTEDEKAYLDNIYKAYFNQNLN